MFGFRLIPKSGAATTTDITFTLSGVRTLNPAHFSSLRIYRDANSNGEYDSGTDVLVSSGGEITTTGQQGAITFTEDFTFSTAADYLLVGDWDSPDNGTFASIHLYAEDISTVESGGLESAAITYSAPQTSTSSTNTTFDITIDTGAPEAGRIVLVGLAGLTIDTLTSASIGGVSATEIVRTSGSEDSELFLIGAVATVLEPATIGGGGTLLQEVFGEVSSIQHSRNNRGGGGSSAAVGDPAPEGDEEVGGGEVGGGELIGDNPDYRWPSAFDSFGQPLGTPANAYDQVDGTYASNNSLPNPEGYRNYSHGVPGSDTVTGIEVKVEASGSVLGGNIGVEISWNNGSSYTSSGKSTGALTTADAVYTLGGPSDLWGRTWTPNELSDANFIVRFTLNPETSETIYVDAIQVRVYHQAGGGSSGGGGAI